MLPSLDGGVNYSEQDVVSVLEQPVKLARNTPFTGRTATQVFANSSCVVKLRTDLVFRDKDVARRAEACRAQEIKLGVYHPHKTWFYCTYQQQYRIGNIAPRLTPLNTVFSSLYKNKPAQLLSLFAQWLDLYFGTAYQHGLRLDEGLSNFGFDETQRLYYLDEDTYRWDEFSSFCLMFAVWCRHYPEIDTAFCQQWTQLLIDAVKKQFNSPHLINVLHGQFRALNSYSERESALINAVLNCLVAAIKNSVVKVTPKVVLKGEKHSAKTDNAVVSPQSDQIPLIDRTAPLAIIADVHANEPALARVLDDINQRNIKQMLVLGDLVGYGPHPNQCVQRLQNSNGIMIQGNHDYAAASGDVHRGFSKMARWAIDWTRTQLSDDGQRFLASLPPVLQQDDWMAVHGAPIDKLYFYAYVYHMTYQANLDWLQSQQITLAFHGHSHLQSAYVRAYGEDGLCDGNVIDLSPIEAALVCPGSVGQPRGGDWRAEYAILDGQSRRLEFIKLEYDLDKTLADMRALGFPTPLIDRYREGK